MSCQTAAQQACDGRFASNEDIAGIGVRYQHDCRLSTDTNCYKTTLAFLLSAWLSLFLTAGAYLTGVVPGSLLTDYDTLFSYGFRCRPPFLNRSSEWSPVMERIMVVISDQQMVTGIGVLVAGFASYQSISVYHWHTVIYLAWMSSNVHLTSLTYLRSYLPSRRELRTWRRVGIGVLFALLLAALAPTAYTLWHDSLFETFEDVESRPCSLMKLPARCFWDEEGRDGLRNGLRQSTMYARFDASVSANAVISYTVLVLSYAWKALGLFDNCRSALDRLTSGMRAVHWVQKLLMRRRANRNPLGRTTNTILLSCTYLIMGIAELAQSFAASLWVLSLSLLWGTCQLLMPRFQLPKHVQLNENSWGFGQVLPMLLLMLPFVAMAEQVQGRS